MCSSDLLELQHSIRGDLGRIYLDNRQYQDAVESLTPVCTGERGAWWLHKLRAKAQFGLGHFEEALADLNTAIELKPDDMSTLGQIATDQVVECPDEAFRSGLLKLANRAVLLNSGSAFAYSVRAGILEALGETTRALEDYTKAFEIDPDNGVVCNNFAWHLAKDPGVDIESAKRAVDLATKAASLQPAVGGHWNTLGVCQFRTQDYVKAIQSLEKSEELGNQEYVAYNGFFLAMAYWHLNHKDEAGKWYDKSVDWMDKNQPKNDELLRFRAEAEALMNDRSKNSDTP